MPFHKALPQDSAVNGASWVMRTSQWIVSVHFVGVIGVVSVHLTGIIGAAKRGLTTSAFKIAG